MDITVAPAGRTSLVMLSDLSSANRTRLALLDLMDGLRQWRLAVTLGWLDIRLRYRGSVLGPFWLTLSTAVMVAALGVLYSTLFKMELHDYLPYLALSLVLWGFLSTLVTEACTSFQQAEGMIRSMRMPFHLHAFRVMVRNVLVLGHNVVVIVVVFGVGRVSLFERLQRGFARPGGTAGAGTLVDRRCRSLLAAWLGLRALSRHPAYCRQRHADCVLHQPYHLEAGTVDGAGGRGTAVQPVLHPA